MRGSGGTTVALEQVSQHRLGSVPLKEGGDWHASLGLTGSNLFVLCPTLQLACLTWWTRHRKAPAIDPTNSKSEAAQIDPASGEGALVEGADPGDKEEAGRPPGRLAVKEHAHVVTAQPRSHASPSKAHERPSVAFTGVGACIYGYSSCEDVTNESVVVLGPPNVSSCHNLLNGSEVLPFLRNKENSLFGKMFFLLLPRTSCLPRQTTPVQQPCPSHSVILALQAWTLNGVLDSLDGSQRPLTNIPWEGGALCHWDTGASCCDTASICLSHQDALEELHSTTVGITKAAATAELGKSQQAL